MKSNNEFRLSIVKDVSCMKTEIAWIKRILFLILAVVIGNVFVSFFSP